MDPHYDGRLDLRIVSDLATAASNACICLYTTNTEPRTLAGTLNHGVRGYLVTGSDSRRGSDAAVLLLESLAFLGRFKTAVVDPAILDYLGAAVAGTLTAVGPLPDDTPPLTRCDRQALQCLAEGLAGKAIIARLGVGRTTVENYPTRLRVKLGAETRPHVIALAARRGLLDP